MAEMQQWERRPRNGALIAIIGAGALMAGVFLPWVTGAGESVSGWDLYDLRREAGENPFVVDKMFKGTFDPFFTAAPFLFVGALLVVIGVSMYFATKRPPPSRYRVSPGLYITGMLLAVLVLLMAFLNVFSILGAPDGIDVAIGFGLVVTMVGAIATLGGVGQSAATRRELAGGGAGYPPQAQVAGPTIPGPQPPNWYPDATGRHQMRYWDGQAWTSHVSDGGALSEDPLTPTS
jgi:hypothetical protein